MKVIWELVVTILNIVNVVGLSTHGSQQLIEKLKLMHPTLYRKARYEVIAEELMERLPGIDFAEALESVKMSSKHRGVVTLCTN